VDDRLKRRLIGAAVLVSLAVIFVPMLVEEDSVPAPPVQGTNIPPREDLTFKSQILKEEVTVPTDAPQPEPQEPPPPLAAEVPPVDEPRPIEEAKPVVASPRSKAPEPADKDREKPKEKPAPAPAVKATPTPAPAPAKPPEAKPVVEASHWVVQVGNYTTREKAAAVASALKSQGLDAFVENLGGKKPTFRVAVGPEEDRRQADALLPKVRSAAPGGEKPSVRPWP
jgi:DedD protein